MSASYAGIYADRAGDPSGVTLAFNASNQNTTAPSSSEDSTKKFRKPYTITKSRESWTEPEHDKFLEAVQLFDRDWKKIESYIGSKTVTQIRSHAQKYFMKVQKHETNGHVPPPRPKRKAIHPYPHKAPENGQNLEFSGSSYLENLFPAIPSCVTLPSQSSSGLPEPGYTFRTNTLSMNSFPIANVSSPVLSSLSPANASHMIADSSCSGNPCGIWQANEIIDQVNHCPPVQAMADFARVYEFVGSIFDPNTSGHLERLKEMDPADADAALVLIKNLAINLSSLEVGDQFQHSKNLHIITYASNYLYDCSAQAPEETLRGLRNAENQNPADPTLGSQHMMLKHVAPSINHV